MATTKNKKIPTLEELYKLAVETGLKADPRDKKVLERKLKNAKEAQKACKTKLEKECFHQEDLWDPYHDSGLLSGDKNTKIKKIAFGIDMEDAEILLIDRLNEKGAGIDAVFAHHPEDRSLLGLGEVMDMQVDVHFREGVPENVVEKVLNPRIAEINEAVHSVNYRRVTRTAELLGIPFGNIHTPCDNMAYNFLRNKFKNKKGLLVEDIIKELKKIPEFEQACRLGNPPTVAAGSGKGRAGKIVVSGFTGGTGGSAKIYEKMANAGIGTELVMHLSKEHKEEAEKYGINVVNCGHMASDSLGINLILDEFEKLGVEIVPLSGLIRYSRNTKGFIG